MMHQRLQHLAHRKHPRWRWLPLAAVGILLVLGAQRPAIAQQGTIVGRVVDAESGEPLSGVDVELVVGTSRVQPLVSTGTDGQFRLTNVPSGRYSIVFTTIGFETRRVDGVSVASGAETTTLGNVELTSIVFRLNPVVVTASRTQEKALDSPSSVYTVDAETIEERTATTAVDHIRAIPGADIVTTGLSQHNVVARGFNNVFSGALFVLTDNRWASVPSLRFNAYNLIPTTNEDIDRIEFVLGPGSALYGPNVDKGVMHIITRSPLDHQGTTVSLAGGTRAGNNTGSSEPLGQLSFRHAGLISDNVGYKLSGMYFNGMDWKFVDPVEASKRAFAIDSLGADPDTLLIGARDYRQERFTGDLRFDFRLNDRSTLVLNTGVARMARSIEMTGIGAAQAKDWTYSYAQARMRSGNLFAQGYINFSNAGDSFTLQDGQLVTDNSLLYVGQVQHGLEMGQRQRFTYGADLIRTIPRTDGIINGRNEQSDNITEVGGYVQSETQLSPMFDLVLAGRLDYHNVVDQVLISPRAALVVKPTPEHSFRLTYNRAFSQPSSNNLFLDKLSSDNPLYPVLGRGAPSGGFTFQRDCGGVAGPCIRSPFLPDRNALLPFDATLLWNVAVGALLANPGVPDQLKQLLPLIPAPNGSQVGTALFALNPTTTKFDVSVRDVADVPQMDPMITNTLEGGWKGLIGDRLLVGIDVYYSKIEDFIGPLLVETPNVFMDVEDLAVYLGGLGLPIDETTTQLLAGALAAVPVGIVTPREPAVDPNRTTPQGGADATSIILTYRNFPNFDLWGGDIGATFIATDWLSFTGSYSYVSENYFTAQELGTPSDLALNSPKNKASLGAAYRNERMGLGVEARGRYVQAFPVKSGVYVSNDAVGRPCTQTTCLDDYTLLDLNISYVLPMSRSTVLTLTGTNILNENHLQMIGAPELASMWLVRVQQSF